MSLDLSKVVEILNGKYDNIPDLRKKVVRIFLSSTFTDTNSERDYLIEKINPKLREYCRINYDIDFQVVDMRWGIPNDAYEYHGTTELCLKEILNCKNSSIGPNFVTLIGQKYGMRPLPTKIISSEFDLIKSQIDSDEDFSIKFEPEPGTVYKLDNVLTDCYKLDTNPIPSVNRILPISNIIPNYKSTDPKLKEHAGMFWDLIQTKLSRLFRIGADRALEKNLIEQVKRDRYFVSITEKEIFEGILRDEYANSSALCFIRNIENLEENLNDPTIPRFIDVLKKEGSIRVDQDAKNMLEDLTNRKIVNKLPNENIFKFNVKWHNNQIENIQLYLENFGKTFYENIVRLIDNAMQNTKKLEQNFNIIYHKLGLINEVEMDLANVDNKNKVLISEFRNFLTEMSHQAIEYSETTSKFFGRDHLTIKIKNYIFSDNNLPFIVTGESGCGKTSVMAIVHQSIPQWFGKFTNYILITRFLGTTTQTSSIFKTYSSIALQLFYSINYLTQTFNQKIYSEYVKCKDIIALRELIYNEIDEIYTLDPTKRIIILLDSLDQLTPNDYKTTDKWLLTKLPANVKLICSTIPDHGNLLEMINRIIAKKFNETLLNNMSSNTKSLSLSNSLSLAPLYEQTKQFLAGQILEVKSLNAQESELILSNWLTAVDKKLTDSQWDDLRLIFNQANLLPLFLKLIYDIVIHWRSFDESDNQLKKCMVIDDIILYMFHRLEKSHGSVIVRRALSYMTVCKNGISDSELEDILSLDDDVLYSVFEFHMPPIRRIPQILWVRIKNDLRAYIVEKEANDTKVIYWYHRRFIEVALEKYVKKLDNSESEIIFNNIFDFYNETWKGKQKPFELNDYLKKKLKKSDKKDQADRYLSSQPIKFITEDGQIKYNKRKLTELPNCLANLNSIMSLEKACELVFFNYDFMHAKFVCESINEVIDDLSKIIENETGYVSYQEKKELILQLKYLFKCLNLCGWVINDNPNSLAFELTSRFLNYYGVLKYITKFIDECDNTSYFNSSLISPYLQNQTPGGYLKSSIANINDKIIDIFYLNTLVMIVTNKKIYFYLWKTLEQYNFLFEIKFPNVKSRSDEFKIKILYSAKRFEEDFNENIINSETLDIHFLIIGPDICFVFDLNSKIRFLYESNLGIIDSFCIGLNQLIIVEKGTKVIKVFPNYEVGSLKFNEIIVGDLEGANFVKSSTSSNSKYENEYITNIDLLCEFLNGDIKQILIRYAKLNKIDSPNDDDDYGYFLCDNQTLKFDSDSEYESGQDSDDEIDKDLKFVQVNKNLSYSIIKLFRSTGLEVKHILKIKNSQFYLKSNHQPSLARTYLSFLNGDFLIINLSLSKSKPVLCYYFKNPCSEPIINIESSLQRENNQFHFIFYTKNSTFLAHSNCKEDEYDEQQGICLFDLKARYDQVIYLNKNYYIISKDGIIECFKLNCVTNKHRTKLIFSINTLSKQVTKLHLNEMILQCGTVDGVFNTYNVLTSKSRINILPSFDRTYNSIDKIYIIGINAICISKINEITIWNLRNGKIEKRLKLEDHGLNGMVKKVKFYVEKNLFVLLMDNFQLAFYSLNNSKLDFIRKINFKPDSKNKSNLVYLHTQTTDESITLFDLNTFTIFKVKFDPTNYLPIEIDERTLPTKDSDKNCLILYMSDLDCVILIDKYLGSFTEIQNHNSIRFLNLKDEKLVKKFFSLFGKSERFKYKIISKTSNNIYISISAFNGQKLLNSLILNFRIIFATSRLTKSIELEIVGAYQGQKFKLIHKNDIFLCLYTGFDVDKNSVMNMNELKLIENSKNLENKIVIYNLKKNNKILEFDVRQKINNLAVDFNLEYLAFTDKTKHISLYNLKHMKLISYLKLYGEDKGIKFSGDARYICLNMNDRRLFSLLIVDPYIGDLSELKKLRKKQAVKKEDESEIKDDFDEIAESSDLSEQEIDSTSDETDSDDQEDLNPIANKIHDSKSLTSHETDTRIKFCEKKVVFPIKIKNPRFDRKNWLQSFLNKIEKRENKLRESRTSKSDNEDYVNLENEESNEETIKSFGKELRVIMATSNKESSVEPKLQNAGLQVRTANISSKACILS